MFLIVLLAFMARDLKLDLDLVDALSGFWGGKVHKGKVGSECLAVNYVLQSAAAFCHLCHLT